MNYTTEERQKALQVDTFSFLLSRHLSEVVKQGNTLHLRCDKSVSIRQGFHGFHDFGSCRNGENGNNIDLLVKFMGYDVLSAIKELTGFDGYIDNGIFNNCQVVAAKRKDFVLPTAAANNRRVIAYLVRRGIDEWMVDYLIRRGLLYEDIHHNCIFLNHRKDWYELRFSWEPPDDYPYEKHKTGKKDGGFAWWFISPECRDKPSKAFITEAAVDAISLYLLRREPAYYLSIGGVGKKTAVEQVKQLPLDVWLAVDNDTAGQKCREKFNDLPYILPQNKDWNEDLKLKK